MTVVAGVGVVLVVTGLFMDEEIAYGVNILLWLHIDGQLFVAGEAVHVHFFGIVVDVGGKPGFPIPMAGHAVLVGRGFFALLFLGGIYYVNRLYYNCI